MAFDYSQVFKIESRFLQNSPTADVTRVDLFFASKPPVGNNSSGINSPGVILQVIPTIANTSPPIPDLTKTFTYPMIRLEWASILTSNNCSVPTRFVFSNPLRIQTDTPFAFTVSVDGSDPGFVLWSAHQGDPFLNGNGTASSPTSTPDILAYYTKPPVLPVIVVNSASNTTNFVWTANGGANAGLNTWSPITGKALTCAVHGARYYANGISISIGALANNITSNTTNTVSNGSVVISPNSVTNTVGSNLIFQPFSNVVAANGVFSTRLPTNPLEFISFDKKTSSLGPLQLTPGEAVYQNTVSWPGGPNATIISVANGSNSIIATNASFSWNSVFTFTSNEFVVVFSQNQYGNNQDGAAVCQVSGIGSTNNILQVVNPLFFTNAAANFMKSPIGRVYATGQVQQFGSLLDIILLNKSNANGSVRFVNNSLNQIAVNAIGSGYNNSDYMTVTGFENVVSQVLGGYPATANIVTFANGSIQSVYLVNVGCGFVNVNAAAIAISNSNNQPTLGSGATFVVNVGSMVKGTFLGGDGTGGKLNLSNVLNMETHFVIPFLAAVSSSGIVPQLWHEWGYYETSSASTISGRVQYAYLNPANTLIQMQNKTALFIPHDHQPIMPSRSNEWIIPWESGSSSNATTNNTTVSTIDLGQTNSSVLFINAVANTDFSTYQIFAANTKMVFGHFIYNNDYTNENTDQGNCWSKYISTSIDLIGNGSYAEDVISWLTAYRPANTDIQVFVRLHKSTDSESMGDKDWTRLAANNLTINLYSSPVDTNTVVDLQYLLQPYPNSAFTFNGTAQTVFNSATLTGAGTTWNTNVTSNLVPGSLIKIWQPLFPNNAMVTLVTAVANDTSITLAEVVSNNGIVGAGLMVDKIAFPYQAYRDVLNSNVCTYWSKAGAKIIGFDQYVTKVCLLGSNASIYPSVSDLRVVALSA